MIDNTNPAHATLKISAKKLFKEIYGSQMAKINIDFQLLDNQNKQIIANQLELSASSTINDKQAERAALKKLTKQISNSSIFTILGF